MTEPYEKQERALNRFQQAVAALPDVITGSRAHEKKLHILMDRLEKLQELDSPVAASALAQAWSILFDRAVQPEMIYKSVAGNLNQLNIEKNVVGLLRAEESKRILHTALLLECSLILSTSELILARLDLHGALVLGRPIKLGAMPPAERIQTVGALLYGEPWALICGSTITEPMDVITEVWKSRPTLLNNLSEKRAEVQVILPMHL